MISLGIETSCDDTAIGIVDVQGKILATTRASQDRVHQIWGGIVPELASRAHLENIIPVIDIALKEAKCTSKDIDIISVAYGPGLIGSLLVGLETAKALTLAWEKELICVNHLRGHVASVMLAAPEIELPSLGLLVSGGHSEIIFVGPDFSVKKLAETCDDAAGESLDKFGRVLGFSYPGGPEMDRMTFVGNVNSVNFPQTRLKDGSLDFSFSGLKTAGIRMYEKHPEIPVADLAASFMKAVVDQLLDRLLAATEIVEPKSIFAVGGVASSAYLRDRLTKFGESLGFPIYIPPPSLCTDNGSMIAYCGLLYHQLGYKSSFDVSPCSRLSIISM